MNFFRPPVFLSWLYPGLSWRVPTSEKTLYLTFDDGPIPGPTEFVLETLKKYKAEATFFCIGDNIQKHPALFKKVITDGHLVGNHTFNHLSGWKTGTAAYLENVRQCDHEIAKGTGSNLAFTPRKLFRPPYGRITRHQIKMLRDEYEIVMWDVLTHDYNQGLQEERCLRGSIAAVRPGSIVVFHDSIKASKNMQYVLPRLLDHFSGEGYLFRSLK